MLAGIQVPQGDRALFAQTIDALGYPYVEETDNPAYRLFLEGNGAARAHPRP